MGRSGKRYQPKVLMEALNQLDYGALMPEWKLQSLYGNIQNANSHKKIQLIEENCT